MVVIIIIILSRNIEDANMDMGDSEMKPNWMRYRKMDMKGCLNWVWGDPQRSLFSGYRERNAFLTWEIKAISVPDSWGHSLRKQIEAGFGSGRNLWDARIIFLAIIILHFFLKKILSWEPLRGHCSLDYGIFRVAPSKVLFCQWTWVLT